MSEDIVFGLHAVQSLMENQLEQVREIQVQRGRKGGRKGLLPDCGAVEY